jgi:hypothetical protein
MKNNFAWMLVGVFLCLSIVMGTAAVNYREMFFRANGAKSTEAIVRVTVTQLNAIRTNATVAMPPITLKQFGESWTNVLATIQPYASETNVDWTMNGGGSP